MRMTNKVQETMLHCKALVQTAMHYTVVRQHCAEKREEKHVGEPEGCILH